MAKKMIEVTTVRESNVVSAGGAPHIMGASFANAGATADAAHYLFSFETERGVNAAELAVKTQKEVNRGTVTEAELFWNTLCAVVVDLCDEYGAVTVQTPFGTIETRCAGSVDNAFAQPAEGSVYLDFVFSDAQRREFAKIEARVPAAGKSLRLVRVTTHCEGGRKSREKVLLVGQPFHLEGYNMTYGGEGERLELWDAALAAKVCDVAVSTHAARDLWFCVMPDIAVAPGRYKLVLNSFAGGDSLEQETLLVDVEGEPTPPEPIAESEDGAVKVMSLADAETGDTFTYGNTWGIHGEGFTGSAPGWTVDAVMLATMPGSEPVGMDFEVNGPTEIEVTGSEAQLPVGEYDEAKLTVSLVRTSAQGMVNDSLVLPISLVVNE